MKTRQPLAAIALLLMVMLLAGCAPSAPEPLLPLEVAQGDASPTPPPIPTGIATATFTPSVTPTVTSSPTPSVTPPPSQTATDVATRTPYPTNTPRPTWTPAGSSSGTGSTGGTSGSSGSTGGTSGSSTSDDDKQGKPNGQAGLNTLNKVANPNFTTGKYNFTASDGTTVIDVPVDWKPWTGSVWPQYYQEGNPQHIFDDFAAWSFTTAYEVLRGGLYQKFFDLQPGALYRANCWMFAYAGPGVAGTPSEGFVRIKLGIDPRAGDNVGSSSVVWSIEHANMLGTVSNVFGDKYDARDIYDPYSVHFTAVSSAATIWIWAESDYAYPRSVVTVDSCEMRAIGWASDFGLPSP